MDNRIPKGYEIKSDTRAIATPCFGSSHFKGIELASFTTPLRTESTFLLRIAPKPKPRMVKSDAWKKRPIVVEYWKWKDELLLVAQQAGLNNLPESGAHITFWIPMPKSWSKKRRNQMRGMPHKTKPDGDNLQKAIQDCLCKSDQHIWDFRVTKRWAEEGGIEIKQSINNE